MIHTNLNKLAELVAARSSIDGNVSLTSRGPTRPSCEWRSSLRLELHAPLEEGLAELAVLLGTLEVADIFG